MKKTTRKLLLNVCLLTLLIYETWQVQVAHVNLNNLIKDMLTIIFCMVFICIILVVARKIYDRIMDIIIYRKYKKLYEIMKTIHCARYQSYFTDHAEDTEALTNDVMQCASDLLEAGEFIQKNTNSKRIRTRVNEMMKKVEEMKENVKVVY